jgi:hypothetical protein
MRAEAHSIEEGEGDKPAHKAAFTTRGLNT